MTPSPQQVAREAVRDRKAMQKPVELEAFLEYLAPRALGAVLEIGGMHGGLLWAVSRFTSGPWLCVDKFVLEGRMEHAPKAYTLFACDSHDPLLPAAVRLKAPTVDLLIIDGDHSYEGVRADFHAWAPLVAPGGVIALHDVSVEQPWRYRAQHDVIPFWNQIRALYEHREIYDEAGGAWGGIGVLDVPPVPERALAAARALGEPTDAERVPHVPHGELCGRCGMGLRGAEETYCATCAA